MKKIFISLIFILSILFCSVQVEANMAAPADSDIASTITFEKNDSLSVISEVLNIEVNGAVANISALYHMKNKTQEEVTTASMFLSPNIEGKTSIVKIDDENISYTTKTYQISYGDDAVSTEDWAFIILEDETQDYYRKKVDTITFEMTFSPQEEHDIEVSYQYALGGYPGYDFDVKYGSIDYYLKPATLWESFNSIEINLILDDDMPKITSSSLNFTKIGKNKYQYKADSLPDSDLSIHIDQSSWDEFTSSFRSPYFAMNLMMFSPLILFFLLVLIIIIVIIVKMKRNKKKLRQNKN